MRWPHVDGMVGTRTVPTLQLACAFSAIFPSLTYKLAAVRAASVGELSLRCSHRSVGGGFSPRRGARCGTTASRAKAPSHSRGQSVWQFWRSGTCKSATGAVFSLLWRGHRSCAHPSIHVRPSHLHEGRTSLDRCSSFAACVVL